MSKPELLIAGATVQGDIACAACGYNLRSLAIAAKCPECGLEVVASIDQARRIEIKTGPPLSNQSTRWLLVVATGFWVYLATVLFLGGLFLIFWRSISERKYMTVNYVSYAVMWAGMWCFTRHPDSEPAKAAWLRWGTRIFLSSWFGYVSAMFWYALVHGTTRIAWLSHMTILWFFAATGTIVAFAHFRQLAVRMRRPIIRRICTVLSGSAIMMLVYAAEAGGVIRNLYIPIRLPSPELPIVGPLHDFASSASNIAHALWNGHAPEVSGRNVLIHLWFACAAGTLIWFALAFTSMAAKKRNSANSGP